MTLVAGDQVRALEHQANDGRILGEVHVLARVVPVQVLLDVLIHGCMRALPIEDTTPHNPQQQQVSVLHSFGGAKLKFPVCQELLSASDG